MIERLQRWLDDRKWRDKNADDFAYMSHAEFAAYYAWIQRTNNPPDWYVRSFAGTTK